jgi:DNA replication protein DnaD
MQWVRRNIDTVRGIHYFSCTDSDDLRRINGYNIAIPAVNINEDGLCLDLINKFKVSIPLYCDNLIDKEKHNKISAYKKDLISSMNGFTSEAIPCASDIYEICNCFDHLMLNASKMNMKLVIQTLFSIRTNCRYIQTVYKKDNIREKSLSHAHRTDQNKCIELFEQYYDMFFSEIEPIISRYIYEIEKIGAADFTDFYSIN